MFDVIMLGYYGQVWVRFGVVKLEDAIFEAELHCSIDGGTAWILSAWGRPVKYITPDKLKNVTPSMCNVSSPTSGGIAW